MDSRVSYIEIVSIDEAVEEKKTWCVWGNIYYIEKKEQQQQLTRKGKEKTFKLFIRHHFKGMYSFSNNILILLTYKSLYLSNLCLSSVNCFLSSHFLLQFRVMEPLLPASDHMRPSEQTGDWLVRNEQMPFKPSARYKLGINNINEISH